MRTQTTWLMWLFLGPGALAVTPERLLAGEEASLPSSFETQTLVPEKDHIAPNEFETSHEPVPTLNGDLLDLWQEEYSPSEGTVNSEMKISGSLNKPLPGAPQEAISAGNELQVGNSTILEPSEAVTAPTITVTAAFTESPIAIPSTTDMLTMETSTTTAALILSTTADPITQTVTVTTTTVSRVVETTSADILQPTMQSFDRLEKLLEQLNSKIHDSILQQKSTEEAFKERVQQEQELQERKQRELAKERHQQERALQALREKMQQKEAFNALQDKLRQEQLRQKEREELGAKKQATSLAAKSSRVAPVVVFSPTRTSSLAAAESQTTSLRVQEAFTSLTDVSGPTSLPKAVLSHNRPPNKVSLKPQIQNKIEVEKGIKPFVYEKPKTIWLNEVVRPEDPFEQAPEEDKMEYFRRLFPELQKIFGASKLASEQDLNVSSQDEKEEEVFLVEGGAAEEDENVAEESHELSSEAGDEFSLEDTFEGIFFENGVKESLEEDKKDQKAGASAAPTPSDGPRDDAFATFPSFEELDRSYRKKQATKPASSSVSSLSKSRALSRALTTAKKRRKDGNRKSPRKLFEKSIIPGAVFENGSPALLTSLVLLFAATAVFVQWPW